MTSDSLVAEIRRVLSELVGCAVEDVSDDEQFVRQGLDSLKATRMIATLAELLDRPLSPAVAWAHPTITSLAAHLLDDAAPATRTRGAARTTPVPAASEPIAVVGIGCRFPQADGVDAYWELLRSGTDAVRAAAERTGQDVRDGLPQSVLNRMPTEAGYLDRPGDEFDPLFFGISPREAAEMDPQQRLFLEVAWEALESAGVSASELAGSRTGVFAGAIWHDYADLRPGPLTSHSATGQALNMIANRLSYVLGLRGPSVTVDTACSSSLLAVHLACQSIWSGESTIAVAGGVNLLLSADTMVALTLFGGLAQDGRCKAFDASGDGFGRGEGCGVVVLKPLSRALADGDDVWCTIRGSATNNDGLSNGLTAPNPVAQEEVLRAAYERAGVAPGEVHFVETHGTGTALGDPIEASALGAVFAEDRAFAEDRSAQLVLGSVKTNIGHLEGAAGIAGLIKTALVLRHRAVPPNLHFRDPNPHIDFDGLGLRVPTELEEWPADRRALAGVSSFGWGGTNVHVVLEGRDEPQPWDWSALDGPAAAASDRKVAFVCSPHGHQWFGMARAMLRTEPVFRAALERCDAELQPYTGWSLLQELHVDEDRTRWDDVSVTQPVLFAIQVALAEWLEAGGVRPDAVTGHSLGEIAAAVIAGILDLPDAVRLVHHYSRLQAVISGRGGGMAIVDRSAADLARFTADGRVVVAARNGPRSTVLAGEVTALEAALAELKADGVLGAMVKVGLPAHSAAIDEILPELAASTEGIRPRPGRIPMYSTVTGRPIDWREVTGAYFCRNLREQVVLADAVAALLEDGHSVLVELSATPVLTAGLEQCVADSGREAVVLGTMLRAADDRQGAAETLAALHALGLPAARPGHGADRAELFTVSARSAAALRELADRTADRVADAAGTGLADLCRAAAPRAEHPHRLAVVARSTAELAERLRAAEPAPVGVDSRAGVAFVFPGQGSQWIGMGTELLAAEPVFHAAIREIDAAARAYLDWSILAELQAGEDTSRMDRIDVIQPVIFAVQVALAALWRSWGVVPSAVVGHSMGEIAASHVAGALSLDDALRVICLRSGLMRRASGQGAMLAVELTMEQAEEVTAPYADTVSIAVSNSARSTVLSGGLPALEAIEAQLKEAGTFCRRVKVDVASHSPQMDPLREDLLDALAPVAPRVAAVPIWSTVTGRVSDGSDMTAEYWVDNLRKPVLFGRQVDRLIESGTRVFAEMSPHPILLPAVEQVAMDRSVPVAVVPSLRRNEGERETLLGSVGRLYTAGLPLDLGLVRGAALHGARLPSYPWQRQRLWYEAVAASGAARSAARGGLLGERLDSAVEPGTHYWQTTYDRTTIGAHDHVIGGEAVLPGAAVVELALAVAEQVRPGREHAVTGLRFVEPLRLDEDGGRQVQAVLVEHESADDLRVFARFGTEQVCVAAALLEPVGAAEPAPLDLAAAGGRLPRTMDGAAFYASLAERGLAYGPAYRAVTEVRFGADEALARLAVPAESPAAAQFRVAPALLDGAIQAALAPVLAAADGGFVSTGVERVVVHARPTDECWAHATVRPAPDVPEGLLADVSIVGADGRVFVRVSGVAISRMRLRVAEAAAEQADAADLRSELDALLAVEDEAKRRELLAELVTDCVAGVTRVPAASVAPDSPMRSLGVDSVMSLELRNRLERRFGLRLAATVIWNYPTVQELSAFLYGQLTPDQAAEEPARPAAAPAPVAEARADEGSPEDALQAELAELAKMLEEL
ncbi:acyltransferase domain-containing protein [Kitasatospora sp. NPDC049285]|uniref:acyltransferase domain-containing protein n=1 Tax=Kitasatospora sp. NPDC049285 TaxID=3157096 RepID=UPI003422E031